jgi:L-seryl-tRNA(Ser) seleniumtransferase
VGRRELVAKLKKSPLARVLRPDKSILAALSATLRQFLVPERASQEVPVWQMMTAPVESLRNRAIRLRDRLAPLTPWQALEVRDSEAEAGSGTMPAMSLPSAAICCLPQGESPAKWARRLRLAAIPVVATVKRDLVWLDLRTILASDEDDLFASISSSLKKDGG